MADLEDTRWTFPAEVLPDNDRTAAIMKSRQEKDAAEKEKFDQL
jgi:hypothetical protein